MLEAIPPTMKKEGPLNFWYACQPDEIFLDLDSNRAISRALSVLRLAVRKKHLPVKAVWLYGTLTPGHAHMIIQLKRPIHFGDRMSWALWMGNDRLRTAYVLKRELDGIQQNDLLITQRRYHRVANAFCRCTQKHKEPKVTSKCPAMEHLLGGARSADYFTRTGKAPARKKIRVPWGRLSLSQLKNWSEVYERDEKGLLQHRPGIISV